MAVYGQPETLMDNQKLQNGTTPFILIIYLILIGILVGGQDTYYQFDLSGKRIGGCKKSFFFKTGSQKRKADLANLL